MKNRKIENRNFVKEIAKDMSTAKTLDFGYVCKKNDSSLKMTCVSVAKKFLSKKVEFVCNFIE